MSRRTSERPNISIRVMVTRAQMKVIVAAARDAGHSPSSFLRIVGVQEGLAARDLCARIGAMVVQRYPRDGEEPPPRAVAEIAAALDARVDLSVIQCTCDELNLSNTVHRVKLERADPDEVPF